MEMEQDCLEVRNNARDLGPSIRFWGKVCLVMTESKWDECMIVFSPSHCHAANVAPHWSILDAMLLGKFRCLSSPLYGVINYLLRCFDRGRPHHSTIKATVYCLLGRYRRKYRRKYRKHMGELLNLSY
jgi:hypothetical protein